MDVLMRSLGGNVIDFPKTSVYKNPTSVLFLKTNIAIKGGDVDLSYDGIWETTLGAAQSIDGIVEDFLKGNLKIKWKPTKFNKDTKGRHRSSMAVELNEKRYVVVVLGSGNYRYATGVVPFKVDANNPGYVADAWCAYLDGASATLSRIGPTNINCTVAYFSAHNDEDAAAHNGTCMTQFNIYLDIYSRQDQNIYTPVSLDPDVGYPGGTNVDNSGNAVPAGGDQAADRDHQDPRNA
jgi:hypothetical protein